jgi:hypothetical protein
MTKRVPTGVSPLGVLALAVACLVPHVASAAPVLHTANVAADGTLQEFGGTFEFDNDVALIHFALGEGVYDFLAQTTSYAPEESGGFDPVLWLYFAPPESNPLDLSLYSRYPTPVDPTNPESPNYLAWNDDQDVGVLDSLLTLQLIDAGSYILALSQTGNSALEEFGFDQSGDDYQCFSGNNEDGSCAFGGRLPTYAGTVRITDVTTVPEPGTLSLLALGSLATALARRRRRAVVTARS